MALSKRIAAAVLAATATLLLVAAAPASASPRWQLDSVHAPQNLVPGQLGEYIVQPFNIGDEASSGTVTLTDELPAGVTSLFAFGFQPATGLEWACEGEATVTCTLQGGNAEPAVPLPPTETLGSEDYHRGLLPQLFVFVFVAPEAAGTADNVVKLTGGGGAEAVAHDPTDLTATPAGFGLAPDSFKSDFFAAAAPDGAPVRQAGSHPFELRVDFRTSLELNTATPAGPFSTPEGRLRTILTRMPPGFLGNPEVTPRRCSGELLRLTDVSNHGSCPADTQVGSIDLRANNGSQIVDLNQLTDIPVYNLVPPAGAVAAFGFSYLAQPVYIVASLDPRDHSVISTISYANASLPIRSADLTLWGVPADPAHDALRLDPVTGSYGAPAGAPIRPFLTMPSQCDTAAPISMRIDSWQQPGAFQDYASPDIQMTGCDDPRFRFNPSITIQPTSRQAASPTGLDVDLSVPQKDDATQNAADLYAGSGSDKAIATPPLKDAVTHLPAGMAVNPSAADGLSGCSEAQIGLDTNDTPTCPDSSKIGTVEIESPLVPDTLIGSIYQAKQSDNPFGSLLGFYTVAQGDGLTIKLAARVDADPQTGNLTTTFLDNPQLTFTHYRLHFFGGPRAALVNPPTCGAYQGSGTFTSWNSSLPAVTSTDTMQITSGPNGSPCPSGGFDPRFSAGASNPFAGAFSPFALEVGREDGTQGISSIDTTLPAGTLAKLAGVPYCPDATLASIPTAVGSGGGEKANPSCPAASLVGHIDAAAGAGSLPFHNPGTVYLAGPYKGAPLSLAVVTPVVGGPLDLGNVVTRVAMFVDPVTAQVRAVSDPLPSMIAGIPLNLRSVRVSIDRPGFTLNPTSCEPSSVSGTIGGLAGGSANVSNRFQVGGCGDLAFRPTLSLRLKGSHKRGGNPALTAVLAMPAGNANVSRARVSLPHSEFLDQAHIGTVCTRVQYAEGGGGGEHCPPASVYGHAIAYSPLLDAPLSGPVFLRSSDNPLPDLVASLGGQIHIDLDGRIDSANGGIRTTFESVPDAPVSRFVLRMPGGRKSLLENSTDLCRGRHRAVVQMDAHNGRIADSRARLSVASCPRRRQGARGAVRH